MSQSQDQVLLTVTQAVEAIAHFAPERPVSADTLRRWARSGRLERHNLEGSKTVLLSVPDLVLNAVLPPEALEWTGEDLNVTVPNAVPQSWQTPAAIAATGPGPLEQQLLAADALDDEAKQLDDGAPGEEGSEFPDDPDEDHDAGTYDEAPHFEDDLPPADVGPADVLSDEDDDDLAPPRTAPAGLAGAPEPQRRARERGAKGPRRPTPRRPAPAGRSGRRIRPAARVRHVGVAAALLLVAAVAGVLWTSGDGGRQPVDATAARAPVNEQASVQAQAELAKQAQLRNAMEVAAASGDYRLAIARAEDLGDAERGDRYKVAAATVLVRRASTAAERGDLDRARGLVQRSRRYAQTDGAARVSRRADAIAQARRERAAKRKKVAARRAAARRTAAGSASGGRDTTAAPAIRPTAPSTSSTPPASTSTPQAPSYVPRPTSPSPTPAPSTGSGSGWGKVEPAPVPAPAAAAD